MVSTTEFDNTFSPKAIAEFFSEFDILYNNICVALAKLSLDSSNKNAVNDLFKNTYALNGLLHTMSMEDIASIVNHLVNLIEQIRINALNYDESLGHVIHLIIDEIKIACDKKFSGFTPSQELQFVGNALQRIYTLDTQEQKEALNLILRLLDPLDESSHKNNRKDELETDKDSIVLSNKEFSTDLEADLFFFHQLSQIVEFRLKADPKRIKRILKIVLEMNTKLEEPLVTGDLTAAVYLHTLGTAQLPLELSTRLVNLNENQRIKFKNHTLLSANFINQLPAWEQTHKILKDIEEWVNGSGYPNGLKESKINEGAKMLAIVIAFENILHGVPHNEHSPKTIIGAIMKINQFSGTQFSEFYVDIFNSTIKLMHKENRL